MLPKGIQFSADMFGVQELNQRFDLITDCPTLACPNCGRDDQESLSAVSFNEVFGVQCPNCSATFTGPYVRGEITLPNIPYRQRYQYAADADWNIAVNSARQIVVTQRDPADASWPQCQPGDTPGQLASQLQTAPSQPAATATA